MNTRYILPSVAMAAFAAIAAPIAHADDRCEIGATMPDGTVCAGISPHTGNSMYTLPADAAVTMNWRRAMEFAAGLDAHGHDDWNLASPAELDVLLDNRDKGALRGTFDESGSFPSGLYWASEEVRDQDLREVAARVQQFNDGDRKWIWIWKDINASVRPVRSP